MRTKEEFAMKDIQNKIKSKGQVDWTIRTYILFYIRKENRTFFPRAIITNTFVPVFLPNF